MVLNNRKVKSLVKENSDLKSENSRLKKTTSNFEIVNTKLENENQQFFKRTNDLENKLRKLRQTSQTINMLPTKDEEVYKQTSGIGFVNSAHVENEKPCFFKQSAKVDTYFV
jgi:regulator of replication initiation timing